MCGIVAIFARRTQISEGTIERATKSFLIAGLTASAFGHLPMAAFP